MAASEAPLDPAKLAKGIEGLVMAGRAEDSRTVVRLKHSLAADQEIRTVLPDEPDELDCIGRQAK